jgi:hypothetical protein
MPSRSEIQEKIHDAKSLFQDDLRREYLEDLQNYVERDVIVYMSGFTSLKANTIPSNFQSITLVDIQGFMASLNGLNGDSLDLILHSPGGSLEAAEQIVGYLRAKYAHIRAIIPQNAMSAATMIACACDEIILGKQSAMGPIDPQMTISGPAGTYTSPAHSILDDFNRAKKEIIDNPQTAAIWVNRINALPPGIINICENTIAQSETKVAEWLDAYMFANDQKIGTQVAKWLGDVNTHRSHGRPIGLAELQQNGVKASALEDDQDLQDKVLSVFHASAVTLDITSCVKFIENHKGKGWFLSDNPQQK